MFKINLKIALRNIWKYKFTNAIKLFGLVIGLSTVIVLISYVMYELSYDKQNSNADRVYRIHSMYESEKIESANSPFGFAEALLSDIPELEAGLGLRVGKSEIKVGENSYPVTINSANPSFFKLFGIKLKKGSDIKALEQPNTVIISESLAKVLFPNGGPIIGQSFTTKSPTPKQIVGVMQDLPETIHFKGDIFIKTSNTEPVSWTSYSSSKEYILLRKGVSAESIEKKIKLLSEKYKIPKDLQLKLMPVTKIHLYSHTDDELDTNGDIKYIYIFLTVAVFILFIALINFINLTVAASLKRGKEIGIKKVMGASVKQLRIQFLSESYIYFVVAAFIAMIISYDLVPFLGDKLGISIGLAAIFNAKAMLVIFGVIILSGFIAGFYPAIILSRLMPVQILKSNTAKAVGAVSLKKSLIVVQFAASAFLIVCTLAIYSQLNFISNKKLGFDKAHVLIGETKDGGQNYGDKYQSFKNDLLKQKGFEGITLSSFSLGDRFGGMSKWMDDLDTIKQMQCDLIMSDLDFIKTLNIEVLKGRAFSSKYGNDMVEFSMFPAQGQSKEELTKSQLLVPLILNETAVKEFNLKDPINSTLNLPGVKGTVIGVVSDFNGMSLHTKVTPIAMRLSPNKKGGFTYIKINTPDVNGARNAIQIVWRKYFTEPAPEFRFLEEHLEKLYLGEMRLGKLFISFAAIAIILCCIGLFGMVYLDLEQRTKEIAVRKVLGASVKDLLTLLNSSFVKIIVVANVIIWPVAYYLIKEWLNGFYYRVELTYAPFLLAFLICLILTLLTVSIQAIRTIRKSPVKALKYE